MLAAAYPALAPTAVPPPTPIAIALVSTSVPATPQPRPSRTPQPPTPTPVPVLPRGSTIGGVAVGGLTYGQAAEDVAARLAQFRRPLRLNVGDQRFTLATDGLLRLPSVEALMTQARQSTARRISVPLGAEVDETAVRGRLERLLSAWGQTAATAVISDAKALTQTFTFVAQPGLAVDMDAAVRRVGTALTTNTTNEIELPTQTTAPEQPTLAVLRDVIAEHATYWDGVAGVWVYDLRTGEAIGYNEDTVFSGASVMKVPIMLFAYLRLGTLNDEQREWLRLVIMESRNLEANYLLANAVGGAGTEDALVGVEEMSEMLRSLGLKHTYMIIPYESGEYLILNSKLPQGGPKREGAAPYTDADPYLRTTPAEMGQLFLMLAQCADNTGLLLERYGDKLNAAICQEMIGWLQMPHDQDRMVAGLPPGTVIAHKGGWTTDFQGDIGIVESPGGRYVAAIYIYRPDSEGYVSNILAGPSPYLGDFSHTIYTFFNPEPLP